LLFFLDRFGEGGGVLMGDGIGVVEELDVVEGLVVIFIVPIVGDDV